MENQLVLELNYEYRVLIKEDSKLFSMIREIPKYMRDILNPNTLTGIYDFLCPKLVSNITPKINKLNQQFGLIYYMEDNIEEEIKEYIKQNEPYITEFKNYRFKKGCCYVSQSVVDFD